MLNHFVNFLFGCTHKRTTFPLSKSTGLRKQAASTYVVCLDCGEEFPYSWDEMRILPKRAAAAAAGVAEQVRSFSASK